jgi:hypothetical protein
MVGTPPNTMLCSVSVSSSTSAGSKYGTSTWDARPAIAPSVASTQPAVWNSGIGLTKTSPRRRSSTLT